MKRIALVLAGFILLCGISAMAQAPAAKTDSASVEKTITDTLKSMYEAEKRKDLKFIFSHLSDDFEEVAANGGIYHKSDIAAEWDNVSVKSYEISDMRFKQLNRDTAYVIYAMKVDGTYKGQPFPMHMRVTTVWTRNKNGWVLRFEQGSPITQAAEAEKGK